MKKIKIKSLSIKRIKLQRSLRLSIVAILGLLLIISIYSAIGAYQQPTTTKQTIPVVTYMHAGKYDYLAYLKNSTLYGNNTILKPGEGIKFKKLIEHINGSFTYQFNVDKPAIISGTYELTAEVQTNLWTTVFTLVPQTNFSSETNNAQFTIDFPIDYEYYENYTKNINEETGVIVSDSTLIIKCTVLLTAETTIGKIIREAYTPSIQVSHGGSIVDIKGELATTQPGTIETTEEIVKDEVFVQRSNMTWTSVLFAVIFFIFAIVTKSEFETQSLIDRQLKKINKKYGEWIVETDRLPNIKESESILVKTLDDLVKISEELGKPIIHNKSVKENPRELHTFYVFDEDIHYQYVLPASETIKKIAKCPTCQTRITCTGKPDEKIQVTCPNCGNKGIVSMENKGLGKKLISFYKQRQ